MQIACKRFGCQKAVEVCYWSCKFRRGCKDWQNALAGDPGSEAIKDRLETAAVKTGRSFDPATLATPARGKATRSTPPVAKPVAPAAGDTRARMRTASRANFSNASPASTAAPSTNTAKKEAKNNMPKPNSEDNTSVPEAPVADTATVDSQAAKTKAKKPAPARPKTPSSGIVYLLLSKNGKYKELRESELIAQAANILNDPSLRLVKAQVLVPQISFKTPEE